MLLPTLQQLNRQCDADQITLLLFRCLCTSDFTFHYDLHKPETLQDLLKVGKDLVDAPESTLTETERTEFAGYCQQLQESIDYHSQPK